MYTTQQASLSKMIDFFQDKLDAAEESESEKMQDRAVALETIINALQEALDELEALE